MKQQNTEQLKVKAFKYYCKGLNSKEIGKLLDVSYRTIQNYMTKEKWKAKLKPTGLTEHIKKLHSKGISYNQIADRLKISRSSVYNHLKKQPLPKTE